MVRRGALFGFSFKFDGQPTVGLFGVLPLEKGKPDQRFVVPSMITVPFDVKQFSDTMILEHLGLDSMEGGCKKTIRIAIGS